MINLSSITPAAPSGATNVTWQIDGSGNVSGYMTTGGTATITDIQNGAYDYAPDTGAVNAFAIALSPAPASYVAGLTVSFIAANSNTGSSTLNINSLGGSPILKLNGATALVANDIVAGQAVTVIYDGTNFQMVSPVANVPSFANANYVMTNVGSYTISGASPFTVTIPSGFNITTSSHCQANPADATASSYTGVSNTPGTNSIVFTYTGSTGGNVWFSCSIL